MISKPIVFSAIQPTGFLNIGNYLGAVDQWLQLQKTSDAIFCIVDLHAITVRQNPAELRDRTRHLAAMYLAVGIDPNYSLMFVQSDVPAHAELAWILGTFTGMGQLLRMTQFKDKVKRHFGETGIRHLLLEEEEKKRRPSAGVPYGLFAYPILMASDILLYQTNLVPVGEDQKQHVELTRDLALRFNQLYGDVFTIPQPLMRKEGARIMALDDPSKKMSKTAESPWNYIALTDDADTVKKKIRRAVTDSGSTIHYAEDKPALKNLLTIYHLMTSESISELDKKYQGRGYADFKNDLTEVIIDFLRPFQERYFKLRKNEKKLETLLEEGAETAARRAERTLDEVKERIGLG